MSRRTALARVTAQHAEPADLAVVPRITLRPEEAAAALGVSRDYFDEHIAAELRVIRRGRLKLYAVRELDHWAEANSERVFE